MMMKTEAAPVLELNRTSASPKSKFVVAERLQTNSRIFAHTRWDAVPVCAGIAHCIYFFGMFFLFGRVPLWVMLLLGLV